MAPSPRPRHPFSGKRALLGTGWCSFARNLEKGEWSESIVGRGRIELRHFLGEITQRSGGNYTTLWRRQSLKLLAFDFFLFTSPFEEKRRDMGRIFLVPHSVIQEQLPKYYTNLIYRVSEHSDTIPEGIQN